MIRPYLFYTFKEIKSTGNLIQRADGLTRWTVREFYANHSGNLFKKPGLSNDHILMVTGHDILRRQFVSIWETRENCFGNVPLKQRNAIHHR